MKYIRLFVLMLLFIFSAPIVYGQPGDEVEMADVLRRDGKIYTVVIGLLIILTAMIVLLIRVDRKIFKMEASEDGRKTISQESDK